MTKLEPTRTSSNLTATERLRELLDERGVEWMDDSYAQLWCTVWDGQDGKQWRMTENQSGMLTELKAWKATPEQAIAATLGPAYEPPVAAHWDGDVLTLTIPRDPSCIRVQRSAEQPCKVYADESKVIAATLGTGTCRPREVRSRFSMTQERVTYYCECGHELGGYMTAELPFPHTYNEDELPDFCPNCGRRVEVDA